MPKIADSNDASETFFTEEEIALIKKRRIAMKGLEHVKSVGMLIIEQCTYVAPPYTHDGKDFPESLRLDVEKFAKLLNGSGILGYLFSKKGWKSGGELLIETR